MRADLVPAPWTDQPIHPFWGEARSAIADNVWAQAAIDFHEKRQALTDAGKSAPKGVQSFLNKVLEDRLTAAGWTWDSGTCTKEDLWLRITFRHQMSLGSDLWAAHAAYKSGRASQCIILAADDGFLKVITPNDATALCSYGKFFREIHRVKNPTAAPLYLGKLLPASEPPMEVESALRFLPRLRDQGVPVQ